MQLYLSAIKFLLPDLQQFTLATPLNSAPANQVRQESRHAEYKLARFFLPESNSTPLNPVQKQAPDARFPTGLLADSDSEQPNGLWASSWLSSEQITWGFVTLKEGNTRPGIVWLLTVAIPSFIHRLQSSQIRSVTTSPRTYGEQNAISTRTGSKAGPMATTQNR